jgi:urease accessory protein
MQPLMSPDSRLALMQLSDSFFPSGSFTLSHGLEYLVQTGKIGSADDVQTFVRLLLRNKVGSCDLVALIHAYRASCMDDVGAVATIEQRLFAQTLSQTAREAQQKSGRALLMVAQTTWPDRQVEWLLTQTEAGQLQGLHPIVFAIVGRAAGLSEADTSLAFLHSFVTGLVGAAIRLGVVGHVRSQIILTHLGAEIAEVAYQAAQMELDQMWSCTPAIEIAQMSHRRLTSRQFTN